MHLLLKQHMHSNATSATTIMVWVWVPRHTTPLTHTNFCVCLRDGGLPGAGTYVTPSLNHAGCVINTSGVFFLYFSFAGDKGFYFPFAIVHQRCLSQNGCVHSSTQQQLLQARLCLCFFPPFPPRFTVVVLLNEGGRLRSIICLQNNSNHL